MHSKFIGLLVLVAGSATAQAQRFPLPVKDTTLTEKLDEMLAGKRPLEALSLKVAWTEDEKETSVAIYGDGLVVHWQGKQYCLPEKHRLALLGKLKEAQFLEMPEYFGKSPWDFKEQRAMKAVQSHGRISLMIGSQFKDSTQLGNGHFSGQFARLTKDLLETSLKGAVASTRVESLSDGLQKILDKKIDTRAMKIEVGYLRSVAFHTLSIEGQSAEICGTDYWAKRFSGLERLKPDQLNAFIKVLQKEKFSELPSMLRTQYDYDHVSLKVQILDKQHDVLGSGFFDDKTTKVQRDQFESIFNASSELHPPKKESKK